MYTYASHLAKIAMFPFSIRKTCRFHTWTAPEELHLDEKLEITSLVAGLAIDSEDHLKSRETERKSVK